jgi:hypothetical protein
VNGIFGDVSVRNPLYLQRPSGTEHESLSIFALGLVDDMVDVPFKPHVKHSVCFVENKVFARFHVGLFAFHQIHESSRGCYHDLNTFRKLLNLVVFWNSSINGHASHSARLGKFLGLLFDLDGKLSGRS